MPSNETEDEQWTEEVYKAMKTVQVCLQHTRPCVNCKLSKKSNMLTASAMNNIYYIYFAICSIMSAFKEVDDVLLFKLQ